MSPSSTMPTYWGAGSCATPPPSTTHPLRASGSCRPPVQLCVSLMGWWGDASPPSSTTHPLWDSERDLSSPSPTATYWGASCRTPPPTSTIQPYGVGGDATPSSLPNPTQDSQSCATIQHLKKFHSGGNCTPLAFSPSFHRTQGAAAPPHPSCTIQPLWGSGSCSPPSSSTQAYGVWGLQAPSSAPRIPCGAQGWRCTAPPRWGARSCAPPSGP